MVGYDQHAAASHAVHCAPVAADSDDAEQPEQPEGESEKGSEQHRHGEAARERRESIFAPRCMAFTVIYAAHLTRLTGPTGETSPARPS